MTIARRLCIFFSAVFLVGFYFGPQVAATFFSPGSQDDPLVTQKWVDSYITEELSFVHDQAQVLESRIKALDLSVEQMTQQQRPIIVLAVGSKTGLIGEEEYVLDAAPFLVSGRILLPLRFVGEAFGVDFTWDKQSKTVGYLSPNGQVLLAVGRKTAQVGERQVDLDVAGEIVAGRTFVPLRFIGESLGAEVVWYPETKKAEIR